MSSFPLTSMPWRPSGPEERLKQPPRPTLPTSSFQFGCRMHVAFSRLLAWLVVPAHGFGSLPPPPPPPRAPRTPAPSLRVARGSRWRSRRAHAASSASVAARGCYGYSGCCCGCAAPREAHGARRRRNRCFGARRWPRALDPQTSLQFP